MTFAGSPTVYHAPQTFAGWLNEFCDALERQSTWACRLLCETSHAIRDYLTVDEATGLAAQLPVLVRCVCHDGWDSSQRPMQPRDKGDSLRRVESRLQKELLEYPERAVAAVFDPLRHRVFWDEFQQSRQAIRKPFQELWD